MDEVFDNLSDTFTSKIFGDELILVIEDYVYEAAYRFLFIQSDDEEMKNAQIKEKITILQTHIRPQMLGISSQESHMALLDSAVKGELTRVREAQRGPKSSSQNRRVTECDAISGGYANQGCSRKTPRRPIFCFPISSIRLSKQMVKILP